VLILILSILIVKSQSMSDGKEKKHRTGPKSQRMKLTGDWQKLIKEALQKKRPEQGWPQEKKRKPKKRIAK
jgi:hypothetical protein